VALLAVLWLSAALTLIAMSTAYVVRTEASAIGNQMEAERAGWLARGAMQAGIHAILHSGSDSGTAGEQRSLLQQLRPGQRWLQFEMEGGAAVVEVVPENAKLSVNQASVEQLAALFLLLSKPELESRDLAEAIADWRSPKASSVATPFDLFYEGLPRPYPARHAPFEELEELLAVKGMDRDLFFGYPMETPDGEWKRRPPLADLLTTEPNFGGVNVNYAAYEVLRVLPGWDELLARAVMEARSQSRPGTLMDAVPELSRAASVSGISVAPGTNYTLTATAQPKGSLVRHSVRARIRVDRTVAMGFQVTGWWEDWPWSSAPEEQLDFNGEFNR
jgi:general secretion pathway protein K